jgi:hypothetical protein
MTSYLVHTAATTDHDVTCPGTPANAVSPGAGSRTATKKHHRGVLAAGMLLALVCTALGSVMDIGITSVQLAGAATRIEDRSAPHVRALSGPTIPLEPVATASQRNAVRTAKDYLDYTAFSRKGLIQQLEFEGFSTEDATFGVDHIAVDWNEQAAKAAKAYLNYSGFSRDGLIDQLEFEGFTPAQAAYGATAAGL